VKKVEALLSPTKVPDVTDRLRLIGVQGATVSEVKGFGRTGGRTEIYRGSTYAIEFLPKIRLQVVTSDDMVEAVVNAILHAARTGKLGDGKIFVSPVDEAIRIRTGESGPDAL
jgi:nitrogen regulatory protein P-II 1